MTPLRFAILFSLCAALVIGLWRPADTGGIAAGIEGRLLDLRFALRGTRTPPSDIAILAIDDKTLAALGAFPPPRSALADGLIAVRERGARVVALDLLLPGLAEGDAALAEALGARDDSILAVSLGDAAPAGNALARALRDAAIGVVRNPPSPVGTGVLGPHETFLDAATLGHVNIALEPDGSLRRMPLALTAPGGTTIPALPLAAMRLATGDALTMLSGEAILSHDRRIALDRQDAAAINYFGPEGTIPTVSLVEAGSADFDGKIVFVGATAQGFGDRVATPYDRRLPGVEALATLTANIFAGETLQRDGVTWMLDVALALIVALVAVFAAARERPALAMGTTVLVWLGIGAVSMGAFSRFLWLDATTLLGTAIVAGLAGAMARRVVQRSRAANLARYQSPLMAETLAGSARPALDGRAQEAAALFVDAAGFTERSVRIGPAATALFLRDFHAGIERAALASSGVVEQYSGDGAMIVFGLPVPGPQDAANALACIDGLFAECAALNARLAAQGEPPLGIRVGAHYGTVIASILGGATQAHVTLSGDVVNAASRFQEVAKAEGARVVVSDALLDAAGTRGGFAPVGPVALRGREGTVDLWKRM